MRNAINSRDQINLETILWSVYRTLTETTGFSMVTFNLFFVTLFFGNEAYKQEFIESISIGGSAAYG